MLDRVDMNEIIEKVDIDGLVERTEIGSLIVRSTSRRRDRGARRGAAPVRWESTRRSLASWTVSCGRRRSGGAGTARPRPDGMSTQTDTPPPASLAGHYAGVASRTAAYVIDAALSVAIFTATVGVVQYLVKLVFGYDWNDSSLLWGVGLGLWLFFYYWYCWGRAGKTPGAALLGIQVVRHDGGHLSFGRAFVRTVVFPFSFLFLGLGLWGALFGRQRRTWQDLAAGSVVVYSWDACVARLRFLARRTAWARATMSLGRSGNRGCRCCCRVRSPLREPTAVAAAIGGVAQIGAAAFHAVRAAVGTGRVLARRTR